MLYILRLNTTVVYILKTIPVQVKGKRLRPFSSIFMKEEIQSIQLVINLLGKLIGQVGRKKTKQNKTQNVQLVQSIQPYFRKIRKRKIAWEITNKEHV